MNLIVVRDGEGRTRPAEQSAQPLHAATDAQAFDVHPGMTAIMVTCSRNQEARCTAEICQLLDRVIGESPSSLPSAAGTSTSTETHGNAGFEAQIAAEVAALRDAASRPFCAVGTGELSCIVMVRVAAGLGDPVALVGRLFEGAVHAARCVASCAALTRP